MIGRPCSVCLFISQPSSPRVTSLHGKEFVDKDLAVVMNHLAAYATVVVLVTSDHAPASVPMLFAEHDFLVSVLVALAVHGLTARGLLVEVIDPPFVHDVVVPTRLEKTPRETQPVSPLLEDPETRSAAFPRRGTPVTPRIQTRPCPPGHTRDLGARRTNGVAVNEGLNLLGRHKASPSERRRVRPSYFGPVLIPV